MSCKIPCPSRGTLFDCIPTNSVDYYYGNWCRTGGVKCFGVFPFYAPAVWLLGGSLPMFPYTLSGNQWASGLVGPPERRHYYELTIDGPGALDPGRIHLKDIYVTHPDPDFPGSFEWVNRFLYEPGYHAFYTMAVWYPADDTYLGTRAKWINEFPCGWSIYADVARFTVPTPGRHCNVMKVEFSDVVFNWIRIDDATSAAFFESTARAAMAQPNYAMLIDLATGGLKTDPLYTGPVDGAVFGPIWDVYPNGPMPIGGFGARHVMLNTNCQLGVISLLSEWLSGVWHDNGAYRGLEWPETAWVLSESTGAQLMTGTGILDVSWKRTIFNYGYYPDLASIPPL